MKRVISKCYIIRTRHKRNKPSEIVKICSNRKLAEYYTKILSEKYEKWDNELTIEEEKIVHFPNETI